MRTLLVLVTISLIATLSVPAANATDSTNQGKLGNCTIVSTMVIGSDGKPHSTVKLVCR